MGFFGFGKKKKATGYQIFSHAVRKRGNKITRHAASVAKRNARRGRGIFK